MDDVIKGLLSEREGELSGSGAGIDKADGMKILMTQSHDTNLLAPQYVEGLRACGADVTGSYYHDLVAGKPGDSFWIKARRRLFPGLDWAVASRCLEEDVVRWSPEVVWIFKGSELSPQALRRVKSRVPLMANYNPDHPFDFEFRGSGNRHVRDAIPLYDLHFTYSRRIMEDVLSVFPGVRISLLPFGYPDKLRDFHFDGKEIPRACFIGHADHHRASVIGHLANSGVPVDVYGPHWGKYVKPGHSPVHVGPPLFGDAYWQAMRAYRVQLNLLRGQNADAHNMRSFEVPAVGGIMLAEATSDHALYFEDGLEVFLYRDMDSLVELAKMILSLAPEQAARVRDRARARCLTSGYSYGERSRTVLEIFKAHRHA